MKTRLISLFVVSLFTDNSGSLYEHTKRQYGSLEIGVSEQSVDKENLNSVVTLKWVDGPSVILGLGRVIPLRAHFMDESGKELAITKSTIVVSQEFYRMQVQEFNMRITRDIPKNAASVFYSFGNMATRTNSIQLVARK